ncbi:Maf family protein [Microvirga antarctica]|uniref:Maf family protein n=1 Tax=Microvirga antarctica TaxID=2819233 RepID=UPI001B30EBC2|nr:Maf family protein [Microvirga antarctica]
MSAPFSVWREAQPLLLASTSPTRRLLLERAGLPVETQAPRIDERAVEGDDAANAVDPAGLSARLARAKALAVSATQAGRLVLGGDQVLACEGRIFHKPSDREAAFRQLKSLSGRTHVLHSAGCLARDGLVVAEFHARASLAMRPLDDAALDAYLDWAGDRALSSVGCYEIETLGVHLFETVTGDHTTILGLPLLPLLADLRRLGCLAW